MGVGGVGLVMATGGGVADMVGEGEAWGVITVDALGLPVNITLYGEMMNKSRPDLLKSLNYRKRCIV